MLSSSHEPGHDGRQFAFEKAGIHATTHERRNGQQCQQEVPVVADAIDRGCSQGGCHPAQRIRPIRAMHDDLREQGVVVDRHPITRHDAGVHPQRRRLRWKLQATDDPAGRQKLPQRIFGAQADFKRMPHALDRRLRQRQRFAGRHAQLPFHQIQPGDHLRDRVLDLQPRIHLHEMQSATGITHELHRAGTRVVHRPRHPHRQLTQRLPLCCRQATCRCFLQDLLVTTLHRAVPLEEMHDPAEAITENLYLQMAGRVQVPLHEEPRIAEGRLRLATGRGQHGRQLRHTTHDAHALATTTGHGLQHHRKTDAHGLRRETLIRLVLALIARRHGNAGSRHQRLGRPLVTHRADHVCRRPDEAELRGGTSHGKVGILGQETVAGMHSFRTTRTRRLDEPVTAQIAVPRRRRPDRHRLIGQAHMLRVPVRRGINRHRLHTQPTRRPDHPTGDLAAIGDEDPAKHHMRNTPKCVRSQGAFSAAAIPRPSTRRVSRGSMRPSSHRRAVA